MDADIASEQLAFHEIIKNYQYINNSIVHLALTRVRFGGRVPGNLVLFIFFILFFFTIVVDIILVVTLYSRSFPLLHVRAFHSIRFLAISPGFPLLPVPYPVPQRLAFAYDQFSFRLNLINSQQPLSSGVGQHGSSPHSTPPPGPQRCKSDIKMPILVFLFYFFPSTNWQVFATKRSRMLIKRKKPRNTRSDNFFLVKPPLFFHIARRNITVDTIKFTALLTALIKSIWFLFFFFFIRIP